MVRRQSRRFACHGGTNERTTFDCTMRDDGVNERHSPANLLDGNVEERLSRDHLRDDDLNEQHSRAHLLDERMNAGIRVSIRFKRG
jgi:hypothetical protein